MTDRNLLTPVRPPLAVILALSVIAYGFGSAHAHHGFAFEFDTNLQGGVAGEVTEVRFVNPHVVYMLNVENADGVAEEWLLQTHNVGVMRRLGWDRDTIQVGDRIEAFGSLGRNGTAKLSLDSVILDDGSRLTPRGGEYADAYTTDEINADPDTNYGITPASYPVDITGGWTNSYKFQLTVDDLEPKPTPFTEQGRAVFAATEDWQDPSKSCQASGLPRAFGIPAEMQVFDAGDHYLILFANAPRRIWMDGREAPVDLLASPMGFSSGHWEDNVLVIETNHLLPGWLDGSGLPMAGEGTRIVERYTVSADGLTMDRVMRIHDPYYTEPLVRTRGSARDDDLNLIGGGSGCDPMSYLRDLYREGIIERLWVE